MSALEAQQQALLNALFDWPAQAASHQLLRMATGVGSNFERGLRAYQANGHSLAERALRAAYPVLAEILGAESFADLARELWHREPPQRGDVAQWGQALAGFVKASPQLQDVPYLADVAHAEWALHRCAVAFDSEADLKSLALLTTEDPQTLTFALAPGLATQASVWPIASILLAHLQGAPSFEQVASDLRNQTSQDVVVWRAVYQPKLRLALKGELAFLNALLGGQAIEAALECAHGLDFSQWLPMAVQTSLVLGVARLKSQH